MKSSNKSKESLEKRVSRGSYFLSEKARNNAIGDLAKKLTENAIGRINDLLKKGESISNYSKLTRYFTNQDIKEIEKTRNIPENQQALIFNWYLQDIRERSWEDKILYAVYKSNIGVAPPRNDYSK